MQQKAIAILDANRIMASATVRRDGWPQTTLVGDANKGLLLYFAISPTSQKIANIERDNRVALAIGRDFHNPPSTGLSIAANVTEVKEARSQPP